MTKHAAARGFELIMMMMMQMAMMRMTMRNEDDNNENNFLQIYNDEQSQWPGLGGEQRTLLKPAGWAGDNHYNDIKSMIMIMGGQV